MTVSIVLFKITKILLVPKQDTSHFNELAPWPGILPNWW